MSSDSLADPLTSQNSPSLPSVLHIIWMAPKVFKIRIKISSKVLKKSLLKWLAAVRWKKLRFRWKCFFRYLLFSKNFSKLLKILYSIFVEKYTKNIFCYIFISKYLINNNKRSILFVTNFPLNYYLQQWCPTTFSLSLCQLLSEFERNAVNLPLEIHFWTIGCRHMWHLATKLDNTDQQYINFIWLT